jgi:hypothetical protein
MKKPACQRKPEKLLYSRKDAAFALSLSLRTIDTMISNRLLVRRRFGHRVVIPAGDVERVAAEILRADMLDGAREVRR